MKAQEIEKKEKLLAKKKKQDAEREYYKAKELKEIENAMSREIYPKIELEIETLFKEIIKSYPRISLKDIEIYISKRGVAIRGKDKDVIYPLKGDFMIQLRGLCSTVGRYGVVDSGTLRENSGLAKALSKNNCTNVRLDDGYYEDYSAGAPNIGHDDCIFTITV